VGARGAISIAIAAIAVVGGVLGAGLPRIAADPVHDARACRDSGDASKGPRVDATRATILCLLNQERARHELPPLRQNAILEAASQRHSEDMARRHFFAHRTPDGMSPEERMRAAGYSVCDCYVGENLYWGAGPNAPPVKAVEGWMDSPGHRSNILSPEFTDVGIGVVYDAPFWVGKRRAAITRRTSADRSSRPLGARAQRETRA
jgi:uncharacterized protein YkwD